MNKEKKLWFILLSTLSLVFAYYSVTFFWGNHDWDWIKGTTQVLHFNTGMFEGRYSKFILNVALFGGKILPVINTLTAFALLALGGVFLVRYWQIKDFYAQIIVALLPLLAPFVLGWLYFPINILGNFSAVALVTGGLCLSEKKTIHKIAAVICWLIALGVYPSVMEMIIICFCYRYILKPTTFSEIIKKAIPIFVALILFKTLLWGLGKLEWIAVDYYNLKTVTLMELLNRFPQMVELAFSQLITTLPFLNIKLKALGLIVIILALVTSICNIKTFTLWVVALGATILSTWLTSTPEETAYMPRVNFYGLNFFYTGAVAILLCKKNWLRNIGLLLSLLIIYNSVVSDLSAQKTWVLGKLSEENLVMRISNRINTNNTQLVPVIAGELALRPRYYQEKYDKKSPYLLNQSLLVRHIPSGMFNFYAQTPIFRTISQISDITPELYQFIKNTQNVWPKEDSLYIDDIYAVILLTPEGRDNIKLQLPPLPY